MAIQAGPDGWGGASLPLRPNPRRFPVFKKFHVHDIRIAANRTIFNVFLFGSAGPIQRDHDLLAACWADIRPFIIGATAFLLSLLHALVK